MKVGEFKKRHTKYVANGEGSVLGPIFEKFRIIRHTPTYTVSDNVSC